MPKRDKIVPGQIYHVCNRGVDKRNIFLEDSDYFRAIHNLLEFNNENPVVNANYSFTKTKNIGSGNQYIDRPRKLLVEILAFCLMPNHFHLLIKPLVENGLELFMRKFGGGYANYFNKKYQRPGALFQGRYKMVAVTKESHFIHLPFYIHLNPLDLIGSDWRNKKIDNYDKTIKFLESYRWSSHLDYTGIKNFPSLTQRDFLLEFFGNSKEYKRSIEKWLQDLDSNLESIKDISLE
jgi:putative transposase